VCEREREREERSERDFWGVIDFFVFLIYIHHVFGK